MALRLVVAIALLAFCFDSVNAREQRSLQPDRVVAAKKSAAKNAGKPQYNPRDLIAESEQLFQRAGRAMPAVDLSDPALAHLHFEEPRFAKLPPVRSKPATPVSSFIELTAIPDLKERVLMAKKEKASHAGAASAAARSGAHARREDDEEQEYGGQLDAGDDKEAPQDESEYGGQASSPGDNEDESEYGGKTVSDDDGGKGGSDEDGDDKDAQNPDAPQSGEEPEKEDEKKGVKDDAGAGAKPEAAASSGAAAAAEPDEPIVVQITLSLDFETLTANAADREIFEKQLKEDLAAFFGCSPDRIVIVGLSAGSVVVKFEVTPAAAGSTEPSGAQMIKDLQEAYNDKNSALFTGVVLSHLDNSHPLYAAPKSTADADAAMAESAASSPLLASRSAAAANTALLAAAVAMVLAAAA